MKFKMWSFLYWSAIITSVISISFVVYGYWYTTPPMPISLVIVFISPTLAFLVTAPKLYSIIKLDKRGVWVTCLKVKLAFIPWDEIKELGIGVHLHSGVPMKWIYFSRYHLTEEEKRQMQNYSVSNEIIKLKYNKKTIRAVLKYWHKEIVGFSEEEKKRLLNNTKI